MSEKERKPWICTTENMQLDVFDISYMYIYTTDKEQNNSFLSIEAVVCLYTYNEITTKSLYNKE